MLLSPFSPSFRIQRDNKSICRNQFFFYSLNAPQDLRDSINTLLHIPEVVSSSFYLVIPNMLDRNKSATFGYVKEKIKQQIQSWECRFMSKTGKELLPKSIAQSIPSYAIGVFLLPISVCKDMERLMNNFWWKQAKEGSKGVHWKSWNALKKHKSKGGLDFRDLHDFN